MTKNGLSASPPQIILLVEPDQVSNYVIQRALDLARQLGVELCARLVQDQNVARAARLPLTKLIGLESGHRKEFSIRNIENQLRRSAEELERHLRREARSRGVACRVELTAAVPEETGTRWMLFGHPSSLQLANLPATRREIVLVLHPPRARSVTPVTAVICLSPPTCEQLEWAAHVAEQSGLRDPLVVFTNHPLRCERESASSVSFQSFKPLPQTPLTASTLLRWIGRHSAASALIILPKVPTPGLEDWAVQMARLSEIPLIFLREAE